MSLELFGFIILSAGALASATVVVVARNPIHSAISLVVSFFFLAGLYLTLNANFVAIIQILVYAGAIMVLFMFVIMLLNLGDDELGESRWNFHKVVGALAAFASCGFLIWAIVGAESKYLGEPSHMRNHSVERLRDTAAQYPFASQIEREIFTQRLGRLRAMAVNKVRLERGTEEVRIDACQGVAAFVPELDGEFCSVPAIQASARGYAAAEIADYDRQLVALEAQIDPSPVPAEWRGEFAVRTPDILPSREERAVLATIDIAFALQIEQVVRQDAVRLLDRTELAALDSLAYGGAPSVGREGTSARDMRAAAVGAPGHRIRVAYETVDYIVDTVSDRADGDPNLERFVEKIDAITANYELAVRDVLEAHRSGQVGPLVQALLAFQQRIDGQLAAAERQQIRETVAKLGRGGPRFLAVTQLPAVYDEDEFGSVEAVGKELLTRWLLPFEVTAMLLLIGIVGATVVAKRRA